MSKKEAGVVGANGGGVTEEMDTTGVWEKESASGFEEKEPVSVSEELDPTSDNFNPLRAIYDPNFQVDDSTVVQDNVEKCIAVIEGRIRPKKAVVEKVVEPEQEKLERQFTKEQLPVEARKRKQFRNVLARMEGFTSGPLSILRKYLNEGTKVKVWTRGVSGVRGVATGFIAAFDKHWNLALTDVEEQFTRKRSKKVPALGQSLKEVQLKEWRVGESLVRLVQVKKKVEICVRHVPQVLLRGEHIIMVSPAAASPSNGQPCLTE